MKTHFALPLLATLLLLGGCSNGAHNDLKDHQAAAATHASSVAPSFRLRGEIVYNKTLQTLQPCGSKVVYWLKLNQHDKTELQAAANSGSSKPIFAEITGYLIPPPTDGFDDLATHYRAQIVTQDIQILPESPVCTKDKTVDTSWLGTYQSPFVNAVSTKTVLSSDHQAKTTYVYNNDYPSVSEIGYWQALGKNQVEVMTTEYDGHTANSRRIFTRTGNQLFTAQETIEGHTYQIAPNGLTLFRQ